MPCATRRLRNVGSRHPPRVFCELKLMKIVILIYQIIQDKFAYGELFMLVMIGYIFMFKMVKKMQNSGLEIVAGLTRPLKWILFTNYTVIRTCGIFNRYRASLVHARTCNGRVNRCCQIEMGSSYLLCINQFSFMWYSF